MYKAIYKVQNECIDKSMGRIFAPFLMCYHLHSLEVMRNGVQQEESVDFLIDKTEWIRWKDAQVIKNLPEGESIIIGINYFYKREDDSQILKFKIDQLNQMGRYSHPNKTIEIISKHYMDGQFSFDNGLYKNAVLNFGIVLEGLLNEKLNNKFTLEKLINMNQGAANKTDMHFIRELRNKVHPAKLLNFNDITREEAIECRNKLEIILFNSI